MGLVFSAALSLARFLLSFSVSEKLREFFGPPSPVPYISGMDGAVLLLDPAEFSLSPKIPSFSDCTPSSLFSGSYKWSLSVHTDHGVLGTALLLCHSPRECPEDFPGIFISYK